MSNFSFSQAPCLNKEALWMRATWSFRGTQREGHTGGNSVPKAYLFQKENITKSWVLISPCQQPQHMNRLNHLYVTFTLLKKLRSGEGVGSNVQREIIYQPWSKALRMATSMSWCSSELMWNTVICFPGKEIALLTCFHRYSPDLYRASDIWSIFLVKNKTKQWDHHTVCE